MAKSPVFIEGLGKFNTDKYFEYIEKQGIINDKIKDVIDNGDGTYEVTTKPGYVFEIELVPTKEKSTDAEITYVGQVGKIKPVIQKIEVSATSTSITGKAIITRLGNGTVEYYYKLKTAGDETYSKMENVDNETGATQITGIVAGEEYTIKVIAKNNVGEAIDTADITATKIFVESIILKEKEIVKQSQTVTLIATIKPDNSTNKNVIWTSSEPTIAIVDENGVVTGKNVGMAIITATTTDGSNRTASCEIIVKEPTVTDIVGEVQTSNKMMEDENGNKIVIPGGFKVVPDGGNDSSSKVDYTYNGDGKPCVQDGIVIEDNEGNQFVWIPVGRIKNKNGTTSIIKMGRYMFEKTDGTPMLFQPADNYETIFTIDSKYQELTKQSTGKTAPKDLKGFITQTKAIGGYYIARYETSSDAKGIYSKAKKTAWQCTYPQAETAIRKMYNNLYVESDLINSYSWDTAIIFIQQYSGNNNYSNKNPILPSGLTGEVGDKVCNIYDMASSVYEWTTEYCTQYNKDYYTWRGGGIYANSYTSLRNHILQTAEHTSGSRAILYIK